MTRAVCCDCCEMLEAGFGHCPFCGSARLRAHTEIEELAIAHIDCDAFYASVEKRDRPELRDEPVIVGHAGGRGVVTTACYIARRYGVRSAMPMFQALQRCPDAVVVTPNMAKYKDVSRQIREVFALATDIIEPVSLDEAYLDLSHDHLLGDQPAVQALASIARRIEREVGITVSIGLSYNKFLAKLASELEKPRGFSVIGRTEAKEFLASLPVGKINGVGAATTRRLVASGIETIGDLQRLPESQLTVQFGRFGRRLARFSHGDDDRAVTPDRPTKSISAETTFNHDTGSAADLCAVARPLCERVAEHLARQNLAGGTVVLKLKTSDFRILTRSRRLLYPTQRASVLFEAAAPLIHAEADGRTFRLIGVGVDQLSEGNTADPPDLFGDAS
jgi:DNA polymerase IV